MIEESKNHKIYMYTNLINNKVYVGRTCQTLESRAGHKGTRYQGCIKFWNAIQKYGWENFKCEIIEKDLTDGEAQVLEEKYIRLFDSVDNGYNVLYDSSNYSDNYRKSVSEAVKSSSKNKERAEKLKETMKGKNNPFYGKHHTKETIEKMRNVKLGKKLTEEHKKKISEHNTRPFLGKHHTKETIEKMRNAKLGKKLTEEHKKKVGLAGLGRKVSEDTKRKISETHKKNGTYNSKPVLCIELNKRYKCIQEAARDFNISNDRIRYACKNPNKILEGYHWKFI